MNISEDLRRFRETVTEEARAMDIEGALFISCMALVGIVGNSILLDVYVHSKKKVLSTYFIIILGIIDLTICCVVMPMRVVIMLVPVPSCICGLYLSLAYIFVSCSIYLFLLIAIDRYQSVCRLGQPLITSKHLKWMILNMVTSNIGMAVVANIYLKGHVDIVDVVDDENQTTVTVTLLMRDRYPCYVNAMLNHGQRKWDSRYILHFSLLVIYSTYMVFVSTLYIKVFKALQQVDAFRAKSKGTVHPWKPGSGDTNITRLEARPCFLHHVDRSLKFIVSNLTAEENHQAVAKLSSEDRTNNDKVQTYETIVGGNSSSSYHKGQESNTSGEYKTNGTGEKPILAFVNKCLCDVAIKPGCENIELSKYEDKGNEIDDDFTTGAYEEAVEELSTRSDTTCSGDVLVMKETHVRCCPDQLNVPINVDVQEHVYQTIADSNRSPLNSRISSEVLSSDIHENEPLNNKSDERCVKRKEGLFQKADIGESKKVNKTGMLSKCQRKRNSSKKSIASQLSTSLDSVHTHAEYINNTLSSDEEEKTEKEDIDSNQTSHEVKDHMDIWKTHQSSIVFVSDAPISIIQSFSAKNNPYTTKIGNITKLAPSDVQTVRKPSSTSSFLPTRNGSNRQKTGPINAPEKMYKAQPAAMSSKIVCRLFLVTLFYYLCWLPFYLIEMGLISYNNILLHTFLMANIVNPLIHLSTSRLFRQAFMSRLKRFLKIICHDRFHKKGI